MKSSKLLSFCSPVRWSFVTLLLALLLCPAVTRAANTGYVIGRGDILSVAIFAGGITQEAVDVTVSSKGTINFPFLGQVKAAGLTVTQLTDAVTRPLARDYFVDPQVNISVKDYRSQKVYITGAVQQPGLYPLQGSTSLLQLIAQAGGVTQDRGNIAYILRGSVNALKKTKDIHKLVQEKQSIQVNLHQLLDEGETSKDVELSAGDVVYVQPASFSNLTEYKVYVLGNVKSPGAYNYQEGLTALDACTMAGGFSKYAAPNRTLITRREKSGKLKKIHINLDRVRDGEIPDLPLKPGDRVYVPESWF